MRRRRFLEHGARVALALSAGLETTACRRPPGRDVVLGALVREVVVPETRAVAVASARLDAAGGVLAATPSETTLASARDAWRGALTAWKQAQCFRNGPLVETNALVRCTFWPARPAAIEAALAATTAIDDAFVSNLGVDARGLYALEYLLYPSELDAVSAAARFAGDAGARRRSLTAALGRGVAKYADTVATALGDGRVFGARFGQDAQLNLSTLVNQLSATIENLSTHRLEPLLALAPDRAPKPSDVEGFYSGISHEIARAVLAGSEELYRGGASGGLGVLVRATAPAIADRVEQRYADALRAVTLLKAPLEYLRQTDRAALVTAAAAVKALELAIKVDVASALGVTITFQAGDGD
jgi:uncharacterized protein